MEGVLSILAVFGMPVAIVFLVNYFKLRHKELELRAKLAPRQLEEHGKERRLLEERIQNLEAIVCSVDFELNQRLNRLAAGASQQRQLASSSSLSSSPSPSAAAPSSDGGAPPATALGATVSAQETAYPTGRLTVGQTVLGRYRVVREVGRGGMGAVYRAEDKKLHETVALKVISSAPCDDPVAATERFRREVHAARMVTHPNVIRIHDLGEDGPLLFLSMEYVEGETLAARVRRGEGPDYRESLEVLGAICDGVSAAHQAGVVHRDLKPQNVLLGRQPDGTPIVKVIDFGLATSAFFAGMTATGMILGTPEYMAPEQLRGGACDARTDVYALGAMSYHLLCGRPPFVGDTPIAVGFGHLSETPAPPRLSCIAMPEAVERVILRALAKNPAERYLNAGELGRELRRAASPSPIPPPSPSTKPDLPQQTLVARRK